MPGHSLNNSSASARSISHHTRTLCLLLCTVLEKQVGNGTGNAFRSYFGHDRVASTVTPTSKRHPDFMLPLLCRRLRPGAARRTFQTKRCSRGSESTMKPNTVCLPKLAPAACRSKSRITGHCCTIVLYVYCLTQSLPHGSQAYRCLGRSGATPTG